MAGRDYTWAVDVARMLRRRGLPATEAIERTDLLVQELLNAGPDGNWEQILAPERGRGRKRPDKKTVYKRIDRARELLSRASTGLSTEQLLKAPRFRASVRASNELLLAQLLSSDGHHASARVSAELAAELSAEFQNTVDEIKAVTFLRRLDAIAMDAKGLRPHDRRLTQLRKRLEHEHEAEAIEDRVRILLHAFSRSRKAAKRELETHIRRLTELDTGRSATVTLTRFRVTLWTHGLQDNSHEMIAVGTEAADWLNAHPQFASVAYRVEFEGSRMSAFLIRKEYERAIALWPQIEKGLTIGSGNWVGLLQIYFLVCLSGRRFSEARNALADYQSKFKSGGPAWRKQIFLLFRAYMLLLIDEALVEAGPISTTPRVYAGTLQKTCSNLLRDKPGTNAAIFILQIIQWLRAHNYSAVIDATERLRKYASRYLNATQTGRTGVFFRAISYIPVVDFDTTRAQERFDTLRSRHADAWTIDRDDAEIVPYEVLWDIIITALERNKGTKRR